MGIGARIKKLIICDATRLDPQTISNLDLREEYANAFRTESYNDFWTRVLTLSNVGPTAVSSTTAARLPSYRLFAEHLLEPDQSSVIQILSLTQNRPKNHTLLLDYFSETANASVLCGLLLKDIEHMRGRYRSLKTTLKSFENDQITPKTHLRVILTRLTEFCQSSNPFIESASSPRRFEGVKDGCFDLLKRLESSRDKAQSKIRTINKLYLGSAVSLMALTVSLTVIIVAHALAVLVAAPTLIMASFELMSTKRLARLSAQLDTAAKGTYILCRDLDTISHLVSRLNDELEHMRGMVKFWIKQREDQLQASVEVARQLKRNESIFNQQLDELEEHLYLCFLTINRARNLVMNEIMVPI